MPAMEREQIKLAAAHRRLLATLDGLDDATARRPSRLPGWSVGHLLTHVARNADGLVRRFEGARRGEIVDQYEGGLSGREAEIEAGAQRSAAELVADVRATAELAERAAVELPDGFWDREGRSVGGEKQTMRRILVGRIREVELHHVDLGLGYEPADWPADFVSAEAANAVAHLTAKLDPRTLLAWLSGRGPAPELPPWP
jgi:maleylpyruvate isomerase